jgi:hypothetical protein
MDTFRWRCRLCLREQVIRAGGWPQACQCTLQAVAAAPRPQAKTLRKMREQQRADARAAFLGDPAPKPPLDQFARVAQMQALRVVSGIDPSERLAKLTADSLRRFELRGREDVMSALPGSGRVLLSATLKPDEEALARKAWEGELRRRVADDKERERNRVTLDVDYDLL